MTTLPTDSVQGDSAREPTIEVRVKSTYIPEQSRPAEKRYVYAYTVTISNSGDRPAQLIGRHWRISDARDQTQEVRGAGVVGEQPLLKPGEEFTYTSGVILPTQTGTMEGSYHMQTEDGQEFDTRIPLFALVPPQSIH